MRALLCLETCMFGSNLEDITSSQWLCYNSSFHPPDRGARSGTATMGQVGKFQHREDQPNDVGWDLQLFCCCCCCWRD